MLSTWNTPANHQCNSLTFDKDNVTTLSTDFTSSPTWTTNSLDSFRRQLKAFLFVD